MSNKSLRAEIAQAISEGVGGADRIVSAATAVFVAGHEQPIVVLGGSEPDVILPEGLRSLASGIRLDVQAILSQRPISTTPGGDERNAVAWLALSDEELQQRDLKRDLADDFARSTAGSEFVTAWIDENR